MTGPDRTTTVSSTLWEDLLADVDAIAAEYQRDGWETVAVHADAAAVLDTTSGADRYGLSVLAPANAFDHVEALVDEGVTFDTSEVYSRLVDDIVLLIVVVEDHDRETVVVYPAAYEREAADAMLAEALDAGTMYTYLHRPSGERVGFEHDEPSVFLPPESNE